MFENVFEVISDHMIHDSSLEDFSQVKKHNITKVRCQVVFVGLYLQKFSKQQTTNLRSKSAFRYDLPRQEKVRSRVRVYGFYKI